MNIVKGQGWPDFVMLEDMSEDSFLENLRLRFAEKQIYTYIGEQVVSMNPFTRMNNCTPGVLADYHKKYMYEVQPHIFALADDTFRRLNQTKKDQCVIVTGESGAGKTEAAKIFMQFLAAVTGEGAAGVKEKLLDSNPVLEAFGNAKTVRNDNSSRFGKYMEIHFDGAARPIGGKVSQYLLEKSRVVFRAQNERSFHIFYNLLTQADLCKKINLTPDPEAFHYLKLSGCVKLPELDDASDYQDVNKALTTLGFSEDDKLSVWSVLGGILKLGNVEFEEKKNNKNMEESKVGNPELIGEVAELWNVNAGLLATYMVSRGITTGVQKRQSTLRVPFTLRQARDSRDSLAKALYSKVFTLVVEQLNRVILAPNNEKQEVLCGILDIYGFEIFEHNSFEQFCINYCNEKLQQLFIKLVLRQEQEEYLREGIEWTEIDYFDNAPIVTLIEGRPMGVFAILDESCILASTTPDGFLEKLNNNLKDNSRYTSMGASGGKERSLGNAKFLLRHYAGEVVYEIDLFMDRNRDTLYEDLKDLIRASGNPVIAEFFSTKGVSAEEQSDKKRKRPPSIGHQFKQSVIALCNDLEKCMPHYIRCIKSNDEKKAFGMDMERVKHQARYLNLVETVRVRRAGFVNRQIYERFVSRYRMISNSTWPVWKGSHKDGAEAILKDIGVTTDDYRLGETKIFIRTAKTLVKLEELRVEHMPLVAIAMQKVYRSYQDRQFVKRLRLATNVQKLWRAFEQRKGYKYSKAAITIQRVTRGFVVRKMVERERERLIKERDEARRLYATKKIQSWALQRLTIKFVQKMAATFHKSKLNYPKQYGREFSFPTAVTQPCKDTVPMLEHHRLTYWARRTMRSVPESEHALIKLKIIASQLLGGRKSWNCSAKWKGDYLESPSNPGYTECRNGILQQGGDTHIHFADYVDKLNRKGKVQKIVLIMTEDYLYKYKDKKKLELVKEPLPLQKITGVEMGPQKDTYIVVKFEAPFRDLVIDMGLSGSERFSEFIVLLHQHVHDTKDNHKDITVDVKDKIMFNNSRKGKNKGHDVTLTFVSGVSPKAATSGCEMIYKKTTAEVHY